MSVSFTSPFSKRRYFIEKKDNTEAYVKVPFGDVESIFVTNGGRNLYNKYLLIEDKEVIESLGLKDKTKKEKYEIVEALTKLSILDFEDFLNTLDPSEYLKLAQTAVERKISDLNKIKMIKNKTNYDILPSILDEDVKFEPENVIEDEIITEEKKSLEDEIKPEIKLDSLLKSELEKIAMKMDIDVKGLKKADIIKKIDGAEAIKIANQLL